MADIIENTEDTKVEENTVVDEVNERVETEKNFSQGDVDNIVAKRLAREKKEYEDKMAELQKELESKSLQEKQTIEDRVKELEKQREKDKHEMMLENKRLEFQNSMTKKGISEEVQKQLLSVTDLNKIDELDLDLFATNKNTSNLDANKIQEKKETEVKSDDISGLLKYFK